jgi:hypothetical protein
MPALVVLSVIGLAAGAVLLVCLRGFSRAHRYEKVQGLLVRVEKTPTGPPGRTGSKRFDFLAPTSRVHTTPAEGHISKKTVALIGLAILLGSRGGGVEQSPVSLTPGSDSNTQASKHLHVPGKQLLRGS